MTFTSKYGNVTGIVLNKTQYNEYHEVIQLLENNGSINSYFYENVNKSRNKLKINIPYEVSINYYQTSGMKKVVVLEIDNYYKNIIYNLEVSSYISFMLELISSSYEHANYYEILKTLLNTIDDNKIDYRLCVIYFSIIYMRNNGFMFKYKKINTSYSGFSFSTSMFSDFDGSVGFFFINDKLVKKIYIISNSNILGLENIVISDSEYKILFNLINTVLQEYLGIFSKSYKKIIELESYIDFFRGDKINE